MLLALIVLALGDCAYLLRDPMPRFVARRSRLVRVDSSPSVTVDGAVEQAVRLTAASGLTVDLAWRHTLGDTGRRPLVLILGGHHTGRDALRLLGPTPGPVVAAMSYPFTGDPRPDAVTFLRDVPRIRAAFLDTPPALMLSLDFLSSLPMVDTTRVEAAGVSLGAPFVTIAGALDHRITRVWAMHGSGGSYTPLEVNMRRTIAFAPARWLAAAIADVIIAGPRLAPEHWVAAIAPRPFVMVNADADERLPREAIEQLFAAAREPKEMIWMPGRHIHADTATIRPLVRLVLARLGDQRNGPLPPTRSSRTK